MPAPHPCLIPSCPTPLHGRMLMCGAHFALLTEPTLRAKVWAIANDKPDAPPEAERPGVLRAAIEFVQVKHGS
jgi:hypothetical protein